MVIQSILQAVHDSRLSTFIRETGVAFPALESVHVIAITLVLGIIAIVDLRLIGCASHRCSAHRLMQELLPFTWVAFIASVATGMLMFASNATTYAENSLFWWKMTILVFAGINMAIFHLGIYRRIGEWDELLPPPRAARAAGLSSMGLWIVVIVLGRWIGFSS